MSAEDWIWIVVGSSIGAVVWLLWRGREDRKVEVVRKVDDPLQKLYDRLK